jgi:hypothetical protein
MINLNNMAQQLYVAYFGRPADTGGLAFWANALRDNPDGYAIVSNDFAHSAEFGRTTAGLSNREIVNLLYQHMFGRDGDAEGLDFWTAPLDQHTMTIDELAIQIGAGAQGPDQAVFQAKVGVAAAFTAHMDLAAEQAGYLTSAGLADGVAYLTPVVDLTTADAARNDARIDAAIAQFTAQPQAHADDGGVQLVGVAHPSVAG